MAKNKETNNEVVEVTEQQTIPQENVTQELVNSINELINGVNIAQSRGTYNLEEAHAIWGAIQNIHRILT